MSPILAHLIGDYLLQNHWMATRKTSSHRAAMAHVATYLLPFLLLGPSPAAFAIMAGSHFLIDRWRLARYLCWAKNGFGPLTATGFPESTPIWLSTWLLIITDNLCHLLINEGALRWAN